jgi:hypothetical protein
MTFVSYKRPRMQEILQMLEELNGKIGIQFTKINPRLFSHVIKKIWIQFQEDMICIFIIRLNSICIPYTIIN